MDTHLDLDTYQVNYLTIAITDPDGVKQSYKVGELSTKDVMTLSEMESEAANDNKKGAEAYKFMVDSLLRILERDNEKVDRELFLNMPLGQMQQLIQFILNRKRFLEKGAGDSPTPNQQDASDGDSSSQT